MSTRLAGLSIPRAPLLVGAALLLVTLAVIDFGGLLGKSGNTHPGGPLVSRALTFEDRADGAVLVRNGETGALVTTLEPGSNHFLRGALRALTRERRKDSIGRATPFQLIAWQDGALTLEDPATGQTVAIDAFGDTQKAVFVKLLQEATR
jgi:putative photosynthetic complex assembly protein